MGGGGFGLFSKPKVTSLTVGHFFGGVKPKSDQKLMEGVGGGSAYIVNQK